MKRELSRKSGSKAWATYALVWLLLCVQGLCDLLPLFTSPVSQFPASTVARSAPSLLAEAEETPQQHAAHCKCLRCTGGKTCCCAPKRSHSSSNSGTTFNSCCDNPATAQLVAHASVRLAPVSVSAEPRLLAVTEPRPLIFTETLPSSSPEPALRPPTV